MFHIHILGAIENKWLSAYKGSEYTKQVLGEWFGLLSRDTKVYICYINHPVCPV